MPGIYRICYDWNTKEPLKNYVYGANCAIRMLFSAWVKHNQKKVFAWVLVYRSHEAASVGRFERILHERDYPGMFLDHTGY